MQITPEIEDIYWYPYRFHGFSSNIYAIDQGDEVWLIDTGTDRFRFFQSFLKRFKVDGLKPEHITKVFFTHAHPDHCSGVSKLVKLCQPEFLASERELSWYRQTTEISNLDGFWGAQLEAAADLHKLLLPLPQRLLIAMANIQMGKIPTIQHLSLLNQTPIKGPRFTITVYPTPGHSPGHVSLYLQEPKVLFSGDIFGRKPNKPVLNLPTASFTDYIQSIKTLQNLSPLCWGSGHGAEIGQTSENFHALCEATLKNLELVLDIAQSFLGSQTLNLKTPVSLEQIREWISQISALFLEKFGGTLWNGIERKILARAVIQHITSEMKD